MDIAITVKDSVIEAALGSGCTGNEVCEFIHNVVSLELNKLVLLKTRHNLETVKLEAQLEETAPANKQSELLLLVEAIDRCQENFDKEGRCPVCGSYSQA